MACSIVCWELDLLALYIYIIYGCTDLMSISQMDFFNVLWGAMCNYQNNLDQVLHPNMTVNLTQNFNDTSVDFVCIIINFDVGIF